MKILRVAQKLYPEAKGGGPYHVHAMSRDQVALGHDVTVLTTRHDDSLPHIEERDGYTVVRFDSLCSPLGNDISPGMAQYLQKADEFDVIHSHSHLYFSTNLAALKRAVGGPPLAVTNHGLYSQSAPEWVFDLYLRSVGRWTFNRADVIFCYTQEDKSRVQEFGVSSRIEVVPNGIDTERFTPDGPKSELIESNGPVLLFVGRFVDGKRPWLAVESLAELKEQYPDAQLYLCGEGPLEDDLRAKSEKLGVADSVTLLGHIPYDNMPKVYRSADVVLLPSRAEGVPRTVLESLASGTPVVTSDLPQLADIIGDASETVGIDSGESIGPVLKKVISQPDTQVGRLKSHSWEQTVNRSTRIMEAIIE